jgi:hypothetical protein
MAKFHCFDCQNGIKPSRYFMVNDHLWEKYGVGKNFLCMSCFENRLGRKLTGFDLTKCFVNEKINPITIGLLSKN